jgi:hypothetical protein
VGLMAGLDGCGKSRPHRDSIPDRRTRNESLCRLSYHGHQQQLYKGLFIWRPAFNMRAIHVGFVVRKVAMGQILL